MTDINDLYEVNDREPGEPDEYDPQPLDLEEVEQRLERLKVPNVEGWTIKQLVVTGKDLEVLSELLGHDVQNLIAELREARQRIAEWEALEKREEWTVTGGPDFPAEPGGPTVWPDAGVVAYVRRHETARLWRRVLSVGPWEPISPEAPF